jgi:hypothetical protein
MSIHPLLLLIATKPELLADHFEAYAELVGEETGKAVSVWKRRLVLNVVALCLVAVCAVLGGVAIMLWAMIPAPNLRAPWILIAVPAVPAAVALLCLFVGRNEGPSVFADVKRQLAADLAMLREVSPPAGPP